MTLNMFAMITRTRGEAEVDFEMDGYVEFHDWQDRGDLHHWMERLYYRKGGSTRSFWKANLLLTRRDLDQLEQRIRVQKAMHHLSDLLGATCSPDDTDDDMRFVKRARRAIDIGLNVVYGAWW